MTCTHTLLLGAKKHVVALNPAELERMTRSNVTVLEISTERRGENGHRQTAVQQVDDEEQSWFACTIHFFTACFVYGLGAYAFVRYMFSLLHMADGLVHVDRIMRERHGILGSIDWNFFVPVGLITICMEMYGLTLTFMMMIRRHNAIGNVTGNEAWDRFMRAINFVMAFMTLTTILLFFYFATMYHYMIVRKVLSLSPNSATTLAIFNNSTSDLIRPGDPIFA